MHIIMVKKRLANGQACDKCIQAEELLKRRGLLDQINEFVWAIEGEEESPGVKLAAQHKIEVAPFFIVQREGQDEQIYTSALLFIREMLTQFPTEEMVLPKILIPATDELSTPQKIIRWGLSQYGKSCGIAFSGAEDVILIDMAAKMELDFSVFCLDTGRLHPETYQFIEKVRKHYGIEIQMMSPKPAPLQLFVKQKGLFSFYEDGHKECCGIRKVEPLRRALKTLNAWITGQRKDQSPNTRNQLIEIQEDPAFEGKEGRLMKLNPLANWTSAQVWAYIKRQDVPFNSLHEKGFISIGCEPCTRATLPREHERAGRWWWEESTKKECGLHTRKE